MCIVQIWKLYPHCAHYKYMCVWLLSLNVDARAVRYIYILYMYI